jgi:hypothetical protein
MTDYPSPLSDKAVIEVENRPPIRRRKTGILVHDDGFSGPGRIRQLGAYKGTLREADFHHLHGRFYQEGVDDDE